MPIDDSPDNRTQEVSASEVPVTHVIDITDSDSDFTDHSDDDTDGDYQLLAAIDSAAADGQPMATNDNTLYYPHNYSVEWIEWTPEAEHALANTSTASADTEQTNTETEVKTESVSECESSRPTIALTDDRINEIKSLMSGFELPNDCIPLWAQNLNEDQWKTFLHKKIDSTNR